MGNKQITLEEKQKRITRLYKRMLRFQSLSLYASKYNHPIESNTNRFDNIIETLMLDFKPAFHLRLLAMELVKLKAIKTT